MNNKTITDIAFNIGFSNETQYINSFKKIFKLTTTSLLSGTKYVGEMEDRIKKLAGELEAHPDVILFRKEGYNEKNYNLFI